MKLLHILALTLAISSTAWGQSNEEWGTEDFYKTDVIEQSNTTSKTDPNYDWSWKTNTIPTAPPPPPVPLDGGASLLLLAGVGYGLHELRKRK